MLPRTFTQQTQLKNFYGYPESLDIDRYELDGRMEDYIVAARELSPTSLTGNQTDWINRHTVYTHGNGLVAAPANRVNAAASASAEEAANSNSGYPVYFVSDLASLAAENQVIPVEQPRIYYGEVIAEADPDYAIVGNSADSSGPREYDTDTEKYTYTGSGGVDIGNWFNRLAFAAKYGERNILFSSAIGSDSKILFNRDPRERVTKVAPWLTADGDATRPRSTAASSGSSTRTRRSTTTRTRSARRSRASSRTASTRTPAGCCPARRSRTSATRSRRRSMPTTAPSRSTRSTIRTRS